MDGVHDLGGMHGFGPVRRERNEPVFHGDWERRTFGLLMSSVLGLGASVDEMRHAIERMDPAHYLRSSYYEHWLDALERVIAEKGIASAQELAARRDCAAARVENPAFAEAVRAAIRSGAPYVRPGPAPRFGAGDRVVVRNLHPAGHTRCPRYVRGATGVIDRCHGTFVFPDARAHGRGEEPQPLYSVRFDVADLFGPDAERRGVVLVDLWEGYLEPAAPATKGARRRRAARKATATR